MQDDEKLPPKREWKTLQKGKPLKCVAPDPFPAKRLTTPKKTRSDGKN